MADTAPRVQQRQARVSAAAAGVTNTSLVVEAPYVGTVTSVSYTPDTTITGANTNSRTLTLVNRAQDGTGAVVVATLALTAGVNIAAGDEGQLTLSAVAGATTVAAGDELAFVSTFVGTGLADPGGLAQVEFSA